jgi:hypothetical protein
MPQRITQKCTWHYTVGNLGGYDRPGTRLKMRKQEMIAEFGALTCWRTATCRAMMGVRGWR